MVLEIKMPYLWFPVSKNAEKRKIHFYVDGEKIQELDIRLGGKECEFYACMDVSAYLEKEMEIRGVKESEREQIFCRKEKPQNRYPFRPRIHFCPEVGWNNDPNGMVYAGGYYHLYYQWNPYETEWGNMHWGHARSKDMLHWEHRPLAMAPNETGTMYSGCGLEDKEDLMGYGKDALLFFYTAAGGKNEWSKEQGNPFTQRLAYSIDGGDTLRRSDRFYLPFIANETRDPKIFYHKPSKAYIMVLYLDNSDFAIFRSEDLKEWKETQRFTEDGMWECPDLFELEVKNCPGESKWVFWSADGYYVTGEFDGYTFQPQSGRKMAYSSPLPYAAQSFSGIEGRVVSMAWVRMQNDRGNYRGMMSLPTELSLKKEKGEYLLCFQPVSELGGRNEEFFSISMEPCEPRPGEQDVWHSCDGCEIEPGGKAAELWISTEGQTKGDWTMRLGKTLLHLDFYQGRLEIVDSEAHSCQAQGTFDPGKPEEIQVIIDQELLEVFADEGRIYGMAELEENILGKEWQIKYSRKLKVSCKWRFIK